MARHQFATTRWTLVMAASRALSLTQLSDDLPNPTPDLPKDRPLAILRHPHNVISAIPSDVGLALPLSHDGLLSELGSSRLETVWCFRNQVLVASR